MSESQRDYAALYSEYYPKIVGYLRRFVGEDAEDVAQEALIKVSRSLDGFRGESLLSTWIYRIATNTAMDHLRLLSVKKSSRQENGREEDNVLSEYEFIADDAPLHDALLIQKDMNECIRGLVNDLPENYRAVLVLSDLEGFTNTEIGDVLGLSLDTVKIRLHRARLQLRKSMDHACHLYRNHANEFSCDRKTATLEFRKM